MDSMQNCIIHNLREVHKNRIIALKITESLKRNKALPEEYRVRLLLCALTYAEGDSFDALPFVILRI